MRRTSVLVTHGSSRVKECAEELSCSLILLFSLSFITNRVPSLSIKANITPVFKSDEKDVVLLKAIFFIGLWICGINYRYQYVRHLSFHH